MADSAVYIELASNAGDFFTNALTDDVMIRPQYATQKILLGTSNGATSPLVVTSNAVGILNSNPAYTLDVAGNVNFTGTLNQNGAPYIGSQWSNNASNVFLLSSNVGIGKSNPAYKLDVAGDINLSGLFYQNGAPYIGSQWSNNSTNVFLLGSNVGLGLSNPTYTLDVQGKSRFLNTINATFSASFDSTQYTTRDFFTATGSVNTAHTYRITLNVASSSLTGSAHYIISTQYNATSAGWQSCLPITTSGFWNATNWLDLQMNANTSGVQSFRVVRKGVFNASSGTVMMNVSIDYPSSITPTLTDNTGNASYTDSNEYAFYKGNSLIQSSGYVGIRTSNPGFALDVNGDLNFTGILRQGGVPYIGSQWSNNSSNIFIYGSNIGINTSNAVEDITVIGGKIYSDTQVLGNSNDSSNVPSFSFREDSNTGIWHPCNDTLGFVAGGVESLRVTPGDLRINQTLYCGSNLNVASNIVANGNLTMNNRLLIGKLTVNRKIGYDANITKTSILGFSNVTNGIILDMGSNTPASNQFLRVTWSNATEIARFTGDGKLGIGLSNPGYKLDVSGDINFAGSLRSNGNIVTFSQWTTNNSNVYVGGNSNVGIGTTTPGYPLHVVGTVRCTSNVYVDSGGYAAPTTGTLGGNGDRLVLWPGSNSLHPYSLGINANTLWYSAPSNCQHQWYINGSLGMTLSNNNLGIGTATPGYSLDVAGNLRVAGTPALLMLLSNNNSPYLQIHGSNGAFVAGIATAAAAHSSDAATGDAIIKTLPPGTTGRLLLQTGSGASSIAINSNQFVGIGTTTPTTKLDIVGTAKITSNLGQGATSLLQLLNGSSNMGFFINLLAGNYNGCVAAGDHAIIAGLNSSDTGSIVLGNWGNSNAGIKIDKTGFVGVGTNAPSANFHVTNDVYIAANSGAWNSTAGKGIYMRYSTNGVQDAAYIQSVTRSTTTYQNMILQASNLQLGSTNDFGTATNSVYIRYDGNVGIGTAAPSQKLNVNGTILASADVIAYSDRRLKSNITIIDDALKKLHKLSGYTFNTVNDERKHTGLIAQEVQEVLPEAVYEETNEDGTPGKLSLAYGNMAGLLVEAIKEIDNKYKKENEALRQEVAELRQLLNSHIKQA